MRSRTLPVVLIALATVLMIVLPISLKYARQDVLVFKSMTQSAVSNCAMFDVHLGNEVQSMVIVCEKWEKGECFKSDPVTITPEVEEIRIITSERKKSGKGLEGINLQIGTDNQTGYFVTYFPVAENTSGWSYSSYKDEERIKAVPGEDRVLFCIAFDTGKGVRSLDCETLSNNKEILKSYDFVILVRALFSSAEIAKQDS